MEITPITWKVELTNTGLADVLEESLSKVSLTNSDHQGGCTCVCVCVHVCIFALHSLFKCLKSKLLSSVI